LLETAVASFQGLLAFRTALCSKHPQLEPDLQLTLELLAVDAFHPQLKTHKLKGKLSGSWACSASYNGVADESDRYVGVTEET
jgi:hypothetical protein